MQIKTACMSSTAKQYVLSTAILMYGEGSRLPVFASVHEVTRNEEGVAIIEAGIPVSKKGLLKLMKTLSPRSDIQPEILGSHILAKGGDHLAWFCPPQKRSVFFKCKELGGEVSAVADNPGLVFIITKGEWYVFAVKCSDRPATDTPLFVAPYLNVWEGGHICIGNIEKPRGAMKFNTDAWEDAFFRSYFTHPNQHGKGELTTHRGGIFSLWRALLKGRKFPNNTLVPEEATLGEMFERLVKNG